MSVVDFHRVFVAMADADLLLLNQVNLAGALLDDPRGSLLAPKTVLLSHGAEVTDLLHQVRSPKRVGLEQGRASMRVVNRVLYDEIRSRRGIAGAVCLCPFDADFERWLGVKRTVWIPRTVTADAIDWAPVHGRFGFLGTLNHAPNLEGLLEVLEVIEAQGLGDVSVRIVGGPEQVGRWLQDRYRAITYLGSLDDNALKREATTWSAFLNPIFCQARGCSTKLATGLAWEIPILTTPVGARGYVQIEGGLTAAEDPREFVRLMVELHDPGLLAAARRSTIDVARSTPLMETHAARLSAFLCSIIEDLR
jgi:hypothetical protein